MSTITMKDLGPWDESTIALLLGMSSDRLNVELLDNDSHDDRHAAKLRFRTKHEMRRTVQSYQGLVIPMTHGKHRYTFVDHDGNLMSAVDDDGMTKSPPLHWQLMALPAHELQKRFQRLCQDTSWHETIHNNNDSNNSVHAHAAMAHHLTNARQNPTRPIQYYRGVPVPTNTVTTSLLRHLRSFPPWPSSTNAQNCGVSSTSDCILVEKRHSREYDPLWDMCRDLLRSVVPEAIYDAVAITRGFRASPPVDFHDTSFRHVLALGEFVGGHQCCEADDDGIETAAIDVAGRVGRMDGRAAHWVDGGRGERFGIVYYCTEDGSRTERASRACHTRWMVEHPRRDGNGEKVPRRMYKSGLDGSDMSANRRLPSCLPIIGLGCSSFSTFFASTADGGDLAVDTVTRDNPAVQGWIQTIRHAVLDRGIFLLDTAPWYGHGISEIVVGYALDTILTNHRECDAARYDSDQVLRTTQSEGNFSTPTRRVRTGFLPRSSVILNTKVGRYEADPIRQFDFSYSTTMKSVFRSLERMNCEYIDVLQLHDPEFAPNMSILFEETIPALLECRRRGWAKAIGLTGYPLEVQHEILVKCSQYFGGDGLVFDQSLVYCHSNLHDMSLFTDSCFTSINHEPRTSEKESNTVTSPLTSPTRNVTFAEFCQSKGINLMAAAPLSMGLLTDAGPPNWHPAPSTLKAACVDAAKLCRSNGVNISSLAVLYSLSQPGIGCTLIGMKDVTEVDVASDLAMRYTGIDFEKSDTIRTHCEINPILDRILKADEKKTFLQLLDNKHGPFASIWASGDYRWDGKAEAAKFWSLVSQLEAI